MERELASLYISGCLSWFDAEAFHAQPKLLNEIRLYFHPEASFVARTFTGERSNVKNRQLDVLIYLLKHKKTTYSELAAYFEVSTKTIERDINRLSSAGIPVYCQQGSGGGVYIDETYKFSTSFFTPEEVSHIVTALHVAKTFTSSPQSDEILKKLCLIAPNITTMFEENVHEYLSLDLYDHPVDFSEGIFAAINECLDFKFYACVDGRKEVACLGYVFKPDGIYLFIYAEGYDLVKISDIQSFRSTGTVCTEQFLNYKDYKKLH